jgi:four helix bundle protein
MDERSMDKKGDRVREKSYRFVTSVVRRVRFLHREKRQGVPTRQLLAAATGIGSNIEAGLSEQSRPAFSAKMAMALREAQRARYWLKLLRDAGDLSGKYAERLLADCEELIRLLTPMAASSPRPQ